jgi:hypothetical protein
MRVRYAFGKGQVPSPACGALLPHPQDRGKNQKTTKQQTPYSRLRSQSWLDGRFVFQGDCEEAEVLCFWAVHVAVGMWGQYLILAPTPLHTALTDPSACCVPKVCGCWESEAGAGL